jgi:hypothetical protein
MIPRAPFGWVILSAASLGAQTPTVARSQSSRTAAFSIADHLAEVSLHSIADNWRRRAP